MIEGTYEPRANGLKIKFIENINAMCLDEDKFGNCACWKRLIQTQHVDMGSPVYSLFPFLNY